MREQISSVTNPAVKRVRRLADRKHRREENAAVVTGLQPVWQAVEAGIEIDTLIVAPELLRQPRAIAMVERLEQEGVRSVHLTGELFSRLSDRDGPTGLAAIIKQRTWRIDELIPQDDSTFVALDRVANPGNLGTILRTVNATGAGGVILVGPCADPYDPAAIKASMGAVFSVPVVRIADLTALFDWARRHDVVVATTSAKADVSLWSAEVPSRLVVLMGSEGPGLDEETLAQGALRLSIPMVGMAESLNLAVATGVILYDIWRKRSETANRNPQSKTPPAERLTPVGQRPTEHL